MLHDALLDAPPAERRDDSAMRTRLAEALTRVATGDRQAFSTVYALTSRKLFGICLRLCGNRQAAEDTLHDVYLIVWRRAGSWDPARGAPITWLATIARNRAIDWRRAQRLRGAIDLDDIAVIRDPAPDAETVLISEETRRTLHDRLAELDARQRDAIREAFFGGATYAELADRRGVPLGTVKSWVRRGLLRLNLQLTND